MSKSPAPGRQRTVLIHPAAPPKPPQGAACNGCGLCCAHSPCPLGMLLSRRLSGSCAALQWLEHHPDGPRYACGALAEPERWLPALPAGTARALVRRWIGAARGCDAALAAEPAGPEQAAPSD